MAVVIRMARHGSAHNPFYRVVAADKRYPKEGRFLEILGTYNPKNKEIKFKKDRVEHWISKGAKPSATVSHLMQSFEEKK